MKKSRTTPARWRGYQDMKYAVARLAVLLRRYGLSSALAEQRVVQGVRFLAQYGCSPTFPTPGRVVANNGSLCRRLQDAGAELAVHGYDHLDFRHLSPGERKKQFCRAAEAFHKAGIRLDGFRLPYLGYTDEVRQAVPEGLFNYSSNKAVWWDVVGDDAKGAATATFHRLCHYYQPQPAETTAVVPRMTGNVLEIPASLPDDLLLFDGLRFGPEQVAQVWLDILHRSHARGELFVLLFHPETFELCVPAFKLVLQEAAGLSPPVWIAPLREVSQWWKEKAGFRVTVRQEAGALFLEFECSPRGTVLIRNMETRARTRRWDNQYHVLQERSLRVSAGALPFIGMSADVPSGSVAFLRDQGYLVETGESAPHCALYLDGDTVTGLRNEVELIRHIESTPTPLVRFWRWPAETRSALCITGDLDAVSLRDYLGRLFGRFAT
jgi:peptidoglycan/xylan/chitin deacetylase (PgdA/CDA1 family)